MACEQGFIADMRDLEAWDLLTWPRVLPYSRVHGHIGDHRLRVPPYRYAAVFFGWTWLSLVFLGGGRDHRPITLIVAV